MMAIPGICAFVKLNIYYVASYRALLVDLVVCMEYSHVIYVVCKVQY